MYTVDNSYGGLRRIDLNSGDVKILNTGLSGAVSADETHVWLLRADQLFNVDPGSGAATLVGPIATLGHNPTAFMSVGDCLYASLSADGGKYPMFVRITKSSAYEQLITTSGFTDITGISTDLRRLYIVDNLGGTGSVMTINEESVRPGSIHGVTLQAGERLNPGEQLVSTNEKYRLVMQLDGNLVEYDGTKAVWASGSYGQTGRYLEARADGNFIVTDSANNVLWSTNTAGTTGNVLTIQENRNVVVNAPGNPQQAAWSSNTGI